MSEVLGLHSNHLESFLEMLVPKKFRSNSPGQSLMICIS